MSGEKLPIAQSRKLIYSHNFRTDVGKPGPCLLSKGNHICGINNYLAVYECTMTNLSTWVFYIAAVLPPIFPFPVP